MGTRGRILLLLLVGGFLLAGVKVTTLALTDLQDIGEKISPKEEVELLLDSEADAHAQEEAEAEITCLIISGTPEGGNDAPQMELIWGDLDYANHVWTSVKAGTTVGYSIAEDSTIWNLPDCLTD